MANEPTDMARIILTRDSDDDIKMRGLEVFVDDEFIKDISFGSFASTDVAPGEHIVKVTNRLYTKRLAISAKSGDQIKVQVGNYFDKAGVLMMSIFGIGHYKVFLNQVGAVEPDKELATVS